MANSAQARKRAKQNIKRYEHNKGLRSNMRTMIKNTLKAVEAGDHANAQAAYIVAQKTVDRMASKGLIHKNKASRIKSRLNAKVKALAA